MIRPRRELRSIIMFYTVRVKPTSFFRLIFNIFLPHTNRSSYHYDYRYCYYTRREFIDFRPDTSRPAQILQLAIIRDCCTNIISVVRYIIITTQVYLCNAARVKFSLWCTSRLGHYRFLRPVGHRVMARAYSPRRFGRYRCIMLIIIL